MKTVTELEAYFNSDLAPSVEKVERKRKSIITKLVVVAILTVVFCAAATFVWSHFNQEIETGVPIGWLILGYLIFIVGGAVLWLEISRNKGFYYDFKTLIIEQVMQTIHPSFRYKAHKFIPIQQFVESHLFETLPNKKYEGDDYVQGQLDNGAKLEFSEIVAHYRKRDIPEDEKTKKKAEKVMFKGLFFVAETNLKHKGHTVITPRKVDLRKAKFRDNVKLDVMHNPPPDFQGIFHVFTDNQDAAKELFNPQLVQRLVRFQQAHDGNFMVSFIRKKLYVGITHEKDLFEPNLWKTLKDFDAIRDYFKDLRQAVTILENIQAQEENEKKSQLAS